MMSEEFLEEQNPDELAKNYLREARRYMGRAATALDCAVQLSANPEVDRIESEADMLVRRITAVLGD